MRKIIAAVLFMLAGALILLSAFAIASLLDEYQDSPDSLYAAMAVIELGLAVAAAVGGALLLRGRR